MSIVESVSLFAIMAVLAAIPSASVALVVTRAATLNFANGMAAAVGIVLGDLLFIFLAITGLSVVAETLGGLFMLIKYLGGAYLIWLGITLLRSRSRTQLSASKQPTQASLFASLLAGFVLTLGDIKAVLFYVSLLPLFIDLGDPVAVDIFTVIAITIVAVGGVKLLYALFAAKIAGFSHSLMVETPVRKTAGTLMVGAGSYLIVKS